MPSETQWEYAIRAGTASDYYWEGKGKAEDFAWFSENSDNKTHPVGQKKPNAFELYDMAGNVWERVQDCYQTNRDLIPKDGTAIKRQDCHRRVKRGGSWGSGPENLGSWTRIERVRYGSIGFRLAQD